MNFSGSTSTVAKPSQQQFEGSLSGHGLKSVNNETTAMPCTYTESVDEMFDRIEGLLQSLTQQIQKSDMDQRFVHKFIFL